MWPLSTRLQFKVIGATICFAGILISRPSSTMGQTPTISVGTTSGAAGTAVDLPVSFTAGVTGVSSFQFDVTLPASLSYVSVTTGLAAATAGKNASANAITGGVRVLIFGLNQNTIGSGAIAFVRLNIAGGTPLATLALGITGISASSPSVTGVSTNGTGGSVTVSAPALPTVTINATDSNASETGPEGGVFTVTRSSSTSGALTVNYTVSGTASAGSDYTALAGSVTFGSGGTSTTIAVTPVDDTAVEGNETVIVTLSNNSAAYGVGSPGSATVTIADNDTDTTAPVISGVSVSSITTTAAVINWVTDKLSDTQVEYGPTTAYGISTALVPTRVATHAVQLAGLQASTLYHYRVKSRDAAGNLAVSGDLTFTTVVESLPLPTSGTRAAPSPDAIFIMSVVENPNFRTNLGINNLSQSRAKVGIILVDGDGIVLAGKVVEVEPAGLKQLNRVARLVHDSDPTQNLQGNLYLESPQPIKAWASQIENASDDPSLLLSMGSGARKILIPSAANISTFRSSLMVMNVGLSRAEVSVRAYGTDGSLLGQTPSSLFISSNGVLSFENILQTLGVSNNYGPVEITSLNDIPIIASSRVSSTNETGGFFEGLDYADASLIQIIPHVIDTAELRTNIGINNVSDKLATVRVRLFDKNGVERGMASVTVAPKGLTQLNHAVRQLINASEISALEGYIRLESDQPIFGWASQIDNLTNDPGFAVSRNRGFSRLLVQSAANVGNFRSSLVVVNTGSADVLVDVVSRSVDGGLQGQLRGLLIPARGFFSSSNILASLGVSSGFGPIEIISVTGQPLMVTSRVYGFSGTSGFFQGQPIE